MRANSKARERDSAKKRDSVSIPILVDSLTDPRLSRLFFPLAGVNCNRRWQDRNSSAPGVVPISPHSILNFREPATLERNLKFVRV